MKDRHSAKRGPAALLHYPVMLLLFGFILAMMAADALTPDRKFSDLENTNLQQRPAFSISLSDVEKGRAVDKLNAFFSDYTQYVKQQITGRDGWIDLQSLCETLVFRKEDYGGVTLGAQHMEFARVYGLTAAENTTLPKNIAGVAALGARYPGRVYLMAVPSASAIYPENLPAGAPFWDENASLDDIYAQVSAAGVTPVDVRGTLTAHKDEYLYYRTDHHWTTDGAYYAYAQLCDTLGLTPFDRSAHTAATVADFHGTNYAKCRQWNVQPDTITYYPDIDSTLTLYKVTGRDTQEVDQTLGLYNTDKFATYDKYAAFLYGNNSYSRLSGRGTGSILVVKDSYANSFVPYLTDNYANVDVVDLRYYNYGLDGLMEQNHYDAILVLYSYSSFKSDGNLYKAGVAG
jgi:hypothetical protein